MLYLKAFNDFLGEIFLQITLACVFSSTLEHLSNSGFPGQNGKKQHTPCSADFNAFEASLLNTLGVPGVRLFFKMK